MESLSAFEHRSRAILDVICERFRHVSEEGFTPDHDDRHTHGELARAAAAYAKAAEMLDAGQVEEPGE